MFKPQLFNGVSFVVTKMNSCDVMAKRIVLSNAATIFFFVSQTIKLYDS